MRKQGLYRSGRVYTACFLILLAMATGAICSEFSGESISNDMILIEGGSFIMGDPFGDGRENERPIHEVSLSDFYLAKYEVTVGEFGQFVRETGYKTSAEGPIDPAALDEIMKQAMSGETSKQEMRALQKRILEFGGAGFWDADKRQWTGYDPHTNWKTPGFKQTDRDPVVALSSDDARQYCNWLSTKAGLPVAYDLATGGLLNKDGNPTADLTTVTGFRLPTEAEWEYAAREKGRKVRFGNGQNIARSSEINFMGDEGDYEYLETGEYLKRTSPVGNYPSNSQGLYDMSGNAWEWAGDNFVKYDSSPQTNPCDTSGESYALRGGRWGGDAFETRVFHRSSWVRNDRCNNSGFRIAKSK